MDYIQALFNQISEQHRRERSVTQLNLGGMIKTLESLPPDLRIQGIGEPHSYRGYYSDLAFEPKEEKTTAAELLALCKDIKGEVFTGYKGGDYEMGASAPVWLAYYGCCGRKILAINPDGTIETGEDD